MPSKWSEIVAKIYQENYHDSCSTNDGKKHTRYDTYNNIDSFVFVTFFQLAKRAKCPQN